MTGYKSNLLSICCLGYNHARFLKENLQSIAQIDYEHIEVIVVDDGSKDNSVQLLQDMVASMPFELKVIAQENTGNIGHNFNNALRQAKGGLITFIALDDVFNPDIVLSEIKAMNANPQLAFIASSRAVSIDDAGFVNENFPELPTYGMAKPAISDLLEFEYAFFGSFYIQGSVFRKETIDAIGGFDEDMTGDDIVLRTKLFRWMLENPHWDFELIEKNNVFYRIHDNNIHKNMGRQIKIVTEYLDRYWPDRPNPQLLIDWAVALVKHQPYEAYISVFALNKKSASLLADKTVQSSIKTAMEQTCQRQIKEQKKARQRRLIGFIFDKKKISDEKRQLILFRSIKISYVKAKKQAIRQPGNSEQIHYSQYANHD